MADRSLTPEEMGPHEAASLLNRKPEEGAAPPPPPRTAAPATVRRQRDPANATLAAGLAIVSTIVGLIVLAWTVLFVTKGRFLKPTFEKYASRFSERQVRVAGDFNFYFDPLDIKFLAEGLTVSNPAWADKKNFIDAGRIDTRIATFPLITGKKRVDWLELASGHVDLEWDKSGQRNTWTFGDKKGEPFQMPVIRQAIVSGSSVRYRDPKMALDTTIRFETIRGQDTRIENAVRFTGTGTMRKWPFRMNGALLSPNQTIAGGKNRFELHASAVDTNVDLSGTLNGMTELEGSDLNARMRGHNLANLFELFGMTAPDTRSYRIRSHLTKVGSEWRFTRMRGSYGNSDIAGSMTVSLPNDRLKLNADLSSRLVDIVDIGPFIGYNPDALATKGATAAAGSQAGGHPRLLPDAPLRMEAISNFDAHVLYKVKDIREPFVPISNINLTFDLDHKLMKLSPLTFDMAGGHVDSDISINARVPAVITEYDIRMSPTPMGKLLARFGVSESGTTGTIKARVQMKGTGDTLRESLASSNGRIAVILPQGTFWTSYTQLSEFDIGVFVQKMFEKKLKEPVQINCGLIAFTVRDGVAAADPILIDTAKNVMTAKGGFSFKDESVNLSFRADGKKFSLFSGQSPVGINGYFAKPSIDIISPQLVARGAAGVGLIAAVNPLAGILAFVDPGDAKAAQCGPVLAGASAAAQRTSKGQVREDVGSRAENRAKAAKDEKKDKKFLGIF